jgi:hypothetical protein
MQLPLHGAHWNAYGIGDGLIVEVIYIAQDTNFTLVLWEALDPIVKDGFAGWRSKEGGGVELDVKNIKAMVLAALLEKSVPWSRRDDEFRKTESKTS